MKRRIMALLLSLGALLACAGCGGGKSAPSVSTTKEIQWTEGRFHNLGFRVPADMPEIPYQPAMGSEGLAYGLVSEEGEFFGFSVEILDCPPGTYDKLEPEGFLERYFPERWEEYFIDELGDEDSGNEIARYNGNPVFCRYAEDLSGAEGDFQKAKLLTEYVILDEGNNRSQIYLLSVYDGEGYYPGTFDVFSLDFCRRLRFDSAAAKAEDLSSEDNSALYAEGSVFEPVVLVLGNYPQYDIPPYYLTVVGAEFFRHDGKEAVRIIYDIRNADAGYERMWQAYEYFDLVAEQDGETLTETWAYEANEKDVGYNGSNPEVLIDRANYIYENEYSNNRRCSMRDGGTVRTAEEFLCDWQGGVITLRISLPIYAYNLHFYAEDDPLMVELRQGCVKEVSFDPADMPCRVKNSEWIIPVTEPRWVTGYPAEGDIFPDDERYTGRIVLGDAEFREVKGETHLFLPIGYTNTGTESNSLFELLAIPVWKSGMADGHQHLWVMQDGVSLLLVESELTRSGERQIVKPGESAEYVLEYSVRTDDPIEVEVNYDKLYSGRLYDGKAAGRVYYP